jgi:predicted amidohydrolase
MQDLIDEALACHQALARYYGLAIVAGSLPVAADTGGFYNRVHVVARDGAIGTQDKLLLTRVERATGVMRPGEGLRLFDIRGLRVGVILCYDSQFPLLAHALAQAGADLLVSPSCTHAVTGFNRVRIGCRARALENQCYSVQAPLVGGAAWLPLMASSRGRAGVFAPPDAGFPEDGIVAEARDEAPGWLWANLDLAAVRGLRDDGEVANFHDWSKQVTGVDRGVETVVLA